MKIFGVRNDEVRSGKAYTFSQVLIRFASLMENVLDSKMMCFIANPRKKV